MGGAAHHCGLAALFRVVGTLGDEDVSLWEQRINTSSPEAASQTVAPLIFCHYSFFFAALSCCRFVSSVSSGSPPPPAEPLSTLRSSDCIFFSFFFFFTSVLWVQTRAGDMRRTQISQLLSHL